jgi:hypothetical protein
MLLSRIQVQVGSTTHVCPSLGLLVVSYRLLQDVYPLTLYECCQNLAASLQQWVASYYLQKALQARPSVLNHIVREAIREDLAGQRWY